MLPQGFTEAYLRTSNRPLGYLIILPGSQLIGGPAMV